MRFFDVDELLDLFEQHGDQHYGEAVSQSQHARQCAALANHRGLPDELIAAALLHDVGHLIDLDGDLDYLESLSRDQCHDRVGADALRGLFAPSVVEPIALHVQAKRWRCSVEPGAVEQLSPASRASLDLQGGLMTDDERRDFESDEYFAQAVTLRDIDDAGKIEGLTMPEVATYAPLLRRLASQHR